MRSHQGQRGQQGRRVFYRGKKKCRLCKGRGCEKWIEKVDYKNVALLRNFVSEKGKIFPRRINGTCAKAQRRLTREIKRARNIALLPFVAN